MNDQGWTEDAADVDDDEIRDLSKARTQMAEDRTVLANERTFAGWMRTGLASIGVGVGFGALFHSMEPPWVPRLIATAFLLLGAAIVIAAERRACAVTRRMSPHYVTIARPLNLRLIKLVTVCATAALVAAIWFTEFE